MGGFFLEFNRIHEKVKKSSIEWVDYTVENSLRSEDDQQNRPRNKVSNSGKTLRKIIKVQFHHLLDFRSTGLGMYYKSSKGCVKLDKDMLSINEIPRTCK